MLEPDETEEIERRMDGESMKHHILVVEDHAELQRMLATALRLSGY
jgi:hypothetical protein